MQIEKTDFNQPRVSSTNSDTNQTEQMIQNKYRFLEKGLPHAKITYYPSEVCKVFTHSDFPQKIFKLMSVKKAKERYDNICYAQKIITQNALNYCYVPKTDILEIQTPDERKGLIIAEFVESTKMSAKEKSLLYSSNEPEDKKLIKEWIRQQAEFICKVGYWDYSDNNVLQLPDLNGFAFIDHEQTYPHPTAISSGLRSLLETCPIDLIDMVVEIGKQNHANIYMDAEVIRNKKRRYVETNRRAQQFFKEMNINSSNQKMSTSNWTGLELEIVNFLNATLNNSRQEELFEASQRFHKWHPLLDEKYSVKEFDQALENLKSGKAIHTWERTTVGQDCTSLYSVYF